MIFGDNGINDDELAKAEHVSTLQAKSKSILDKTDHILKVQQMNHDTEDQLFEVDPL